MGCDLLNGQIDVRYSIEGESSAEVHALISKISERIDETVESRVTTATTPADQLEVACV